MIVFTSGMVALTNAVDHGETLMEHVYPSDPLALPLMKQTLITGLEIKLERTHDLSAVIHADRLPDGRIMITAMPLLYGSYTVTRGPGTFTLEPPLDLNLKAGWPLFKESTRVAAETRYRERVSPTRQSPVVAGLAPTPPPPAENALIRVEPAQQIEAPIVAAVVADAETDRHAKGESWRRTKRPSPTPSASSPARLIAQNHAFRSSLAAAAEMRGHSSPVRHSSRRRRRFTGSGPAGRFADATGDHGRFAGLDRRRRNLENISTGKNAGRPAHPDFRSDRSRGTRPRRANAFI